MVEPSAKLLTRFTFKQYTGGVIIVQGLLPGVPDSLNFILDTGSGGISLDSTTCADFQLPIKPSDTTINGIGGMKKVSFLFNQTLNLHGLQVKNLNFHVNNYEVLTSVYGEKIDGIIGYSFLSRYIVTIDYDSLKISVYQPGKMRYPQGGHLLKPVFTSLPIQFMTVKDRIKLGYNFYIDTGAGLCVLLSDKFVKDSSLLLKKRKPVITGAEGIVGRLQMQLTVIKELKVGPYRFKNVPAYIYQDDYNVLNYPFTAGLLGSEILRRFNIIINYPKREIHLLPNNKYLEVFDYSYTGFSFYAIDGLIVVEDVIKNSPADLAGIKIGDEVIAVGNLFNLNIQAYKQALQSPNSKIKLILRRNENLITINFKTSSIL